MMLEFIFIFASGFLSAIWLVIMFWHDKPRSPDIYGLDQPDIRLTAIQSEHIRINSHDQRQ
jgi:hypothetical protein